MYIFTHKGHICKRNTVKVECKSQPKFSKVFLIFEHHNKIQDSFSFFFLVSFQEKPPFSYTSGPFFSVEEMSDFIILVTLTILYSVKPYFSYFML